jgi:hypothetical protein
MDKSLIGMVRAETQIVIVIRGADRWSVVSRVEVEKGEQNGR